jgi:hypothetical protein
MPVAPLGYLREKSVPANKSSTSSDQKLVNNLTIADARHIVNCEGGELTAGDIAIELTTTAIVSATLARAIWVGDATSWHLFLPMLAQYFALILVLPVIYLFIRHPDLRKDSIGALRLIIALVVIGAVALGIQSYRTEIPWRQLLDDYLAQAYRSVVDAQMHWPILLAVAAILWAIPRRIRNLYIHGPPFYGVSLGCAMRFVIPLLGCFLLPFIASGGIPVVWVLWAIILLADILALWMHWDLQARLRKLDGSQLNDQRILK